MKQTVTFRDKGSCPIGSGEKVFVLDWEEVNGKRGTAAVRLLNILCGADGCTVEFEYRLY